MTALTGLIDHSCPSERIISMRKVQSGTTARYCAIAFAPIIPESDVADFVRLSREAMSVLLAHPVMIDGRDQAVEEFASFHGLRRSDALIVPVRRFHRSMILVIARTETWRVDRAKLLALKQTATFAGRRVVLVPAGRIRRAAFLSNCALVASSASTAVTATLRMSIIDQLISDPASTLRDCAVSIAGHDDPVGAILSLVSAGFLKIDLQKRIGPDTQISLA